MFTSSHVNVAFGAKVYFSDINSIGNYKSYSTANLEELSMNGNIRIMIQCIN